MMPNMTQNYSLSKNVSIGFSTSRVDHWTNISWEVWLQDIAVLVQLVSVFHAEVVNTVAKWWTPMMSPDAWFNCDIKASVIYRRKRPKQQKWGHQKCRTAKNYNMGGQLLIKDPHYRPFVRGNLRRQFHPVKRVCNATPASMPWRIYAMITKKHNSCA